MNGAEMRLKALGARAVEGALAKISTSDGQVLEDFADEYMDIWQQIGEK